MRALRQNALTKALPILRMQQILGNA